jgi:spoIIIJ-associated protein
MANQVADQVRRSRDSRLLEALNPFERRLIHTSLATHGDIETVSEGDGLYKRIRVIYRGKQGIQRD